MGIDKPVFEISEKKNRDSNQSSQLQRLARKLKFNYFACSKFRYENNDTFQKANNKDADQSAQMCRLVCAFVVRKPQRQVSWRPGPNMAVSETFGLTNLKLKRHLVFKII